MSNKYKIDKGIAEKEIINFFSDLSENFIINIKKGSLKPRLKMGYSFMKMLQFKEVFNLFDNKKRYDLPVIARNPFYLLFYLLIKIPFYHPLIYLFILGIFFSAGETIGKSLFFTINIFFSVSIHEFSHIIALYLLGEKDKLAFIGRKSFTIGVYRERIDPFKDIIVSLAGPVVPFLIGLIILFTTNSSISYLIGFIWISNILTLVIGTDGKNIFHSVKTLMLKRGIT